MLSFVLNALHCEFVMLLPRTRLLCLLVLAALLPACTDSTRTPQPVPHVTVTRPKQQVIAVPRQYPCQIRSHHHIDVRTPIKGYLAVINVKEGQSVKSGDSLFEMTSTFDKDRPQLANDDPGQIKAAFDGMIGAIAFKRGSAVQIGATLTTLSDISRMRINFAVSEAQYSEFQKANLDEHPEDVQVELVVNGDVYPHGGKLNLASMNLSPQHGQYTLRADFPNPDSLLRHGQVGILTVSLTLHDAIVIPQQATFADRDERYVYVVDKTNVAHRRHIEIRDEADGLFVIQKGVDVDDTIVLDGVRQVKDGEKVQFDAP